MLRILFKIFYFIKILYKAKYKFNFPDPKPILIYDGDLNPFKKYLAGK